MIAIKKSTPIMSRYRLLPIVTFFMKLSIQHVYTLSSHVVIKTTCASKTVLYTKEMCYNETYICVTITYTKLEYDCQNNLFTIVGSALMLSDSISSDSSLVSQINSHVINSTLLFSMTPFVTKVISIEDSPRSTSFLVSETTLNFLSTITGLFGNSVTSFFSTSRLIIEPTLSQESTVQHSTEIRSKLVNTTFFGNELFSTPTPFIMTSRISESLILLSLPDSSSIMYSSLLVEKTTYLKSLSAYLHSSILSKSEVNQSDKTTHQTLFLTKELKTDNFFDSVSRTTNPINLFTNSDTAFASKFNFSTKSLLEGTATTNSISSTFIQSSSVIKMFSDISILNMTNRVGIESSILDSVSTINMNKSMFSYIYATKSFSNSIVNKSISYSVNSSITDMIQSSILDVLDNSKIYKTPTLIFPSKTNIFNSVSILSNSLEFNSNKVFTSFGSKSNIPDSISVSTKSTSSLTLSQLFTTQAAESLLNSIPVKSVFYSLSSDFSKIVRSSTWNVLNSTLIERTPAMFSSKFSIFNSDHIFSHSLGFSSPYTVNINHNVTITTSQNIPSVTNVTVVQMNSSLLPSYINTYAILTSNFNNSYFSTVLETSFVASESFIGTKQSSISNFSAMITPSFSLVCTAIIMSSYVPCWTTSDVTQTDTNSVYDQSNFSTVSQDLKSLIQPTESFPSTADTTNVESSNLKSEFIITSSKDVLLPNQSFTATLSMCLIYYSTLVLNSLDISLTSDVSNKFTDTVLVSTPNTVWFNTNGYSLQVTSSILDDISSKKMTNEISYTATSVLNIVPSFSALEFSSLNTVFVFSDNLVTSQSIQSIFNQTTMQLSTLPNTLITSTPNTLASVDIFSSVIGSSVELASLISGSSYPGIDSTATSTDFVSFIEPTNVTLIPSIMSATFLETIVCMSYTVIESSFSSFIISTIVNTSTTSRSFTTLVTDLSIQTTQSFSIYSSALPITTTKPETTLIPVDIVVRISLSINESVDVTSNEFRKDLERKLVETFISLKSANKRKRRSVSINNITAMIEKTQRIGQQVIVEFTIAEDNAYLKASDIASVYNYLSESGLSRKLGYKVNGPVSVSLPTTMPYQLSDVVGIVVVESASNNLSLPLNQFYFENNLTEYYNQYYNDSLIKVKTIFSKIEVSQQIYLELVFIVNGVSQNASSIVSFFNNKNLTELSMGLSIQVLEKPFVVNAIRAVKQTDIIKIVIKTPNSLNISNPAYMYDLSLKLSLIYMKGQQRNRLRRATGSVVADIRSIYDLYNGNHQAIFVIIDQGVIKTASEAVAIMNKISVSDMSALLEMQVISPPETFLSTIVKSSYVVKYWIIAVVIVPIIFITFLCIGIIWKYKSKLAPRKIQPRKIEPEKIMESTHGSNLVSPVINKKNVLNEKQSISVPLFSASNEMQNESEHNKSLRRKLKYEKNYLDKIKLPKKEHVNNEDQEDGCEDNGDDSDDNDNEEEDDEDENKQLPIVSIRKKVSTPVGKQNSKYTHLENEKSMFPLSPIYQRPKTLSASIDKSSEVKANAVTNDELLVPINNYAANVPTFKQMTEMKSLTPAPPVRFRRTIESSIDSFTNPTGPLPLLSMKKTSLISTQQNMTENMQTSLYQHKTPEIITMDSDLQHKIEVERQRNKQRQRNQFFKSPVSATAESVFTIKDKVWSREQKKIDDILEPSLTTRKGRKRRRMRRKYKVHISPNAVDGHLMKKMLDLNSGEYKKAPESTQQTVFNSFQDNTHEMESSDTDISMREARQRIHSLLDDTFSAIKNYQKNLIKDEPLIKNTLPKPDFSQKLQSGLSSTPAALPIAPALGRTAIPVGSTSDSKFLQNAYANPYSPYINSTPFVEPLLSWDPVERQRFVNQRLGYPVYGQIPTSLTLPYGAPGQNVYVTPVHQRPDGVGNMVWTPHFETLVNPIQPFNVMDRNMLSGFPQSHSTVLDMNDYGDIKRKPGSQPLIRAIKDELQRLSNSAQGRTKVQEFQTRPTINESVT